MHISPLQSSNPSELFQHCCELLTQDPTHFQLFWQQHGQAIQEHSATPSLSTVPPSSDLDQPRQQLQHPAALSALALCRRGLSAEQSLDSLEAPQTWKSWYAAWRQEQAFLALLPACSDTRITVILPTYNRLPQLQNAVACIRAQSSSNWQLLIGDDASSDDTQAWCQQVAQQDSRIRYLRQPHNLGMRGNVDALYDAVETEWVTTLADDDALLPQALEHCQRLIQRYPHVAAVAGGYYQLDLIRGQLHAKQNGPYYPQDCIADPATELQRCGIINPIFGGGLVVRRSVLQKLSPLDPSLENYRYSSWDYWLSSALLSHYEVAYSPEILSVFANRQAEDSQTTGRDWASGLLGMMQQILERYQALWGAGQYPQQILDYFISVLLDSQIQGNFQRLLKQVPDSDYAAELRRQEELWQDYRQLRAQRQSTDAQHLLIHEGNVSGLGGGVIPGIQQGQIPAVLQTMIQRHIQATPYSRPPGQQRGRP